MTELIKAALKYIGYMMAIVGFATFVWKIAVYVDRKNNKVTSVEAVVSTVTVDLQGLKLEFTKLKDTVQNQYKRIEIGLNEQKEISNTILTKQTSLNNSYVLHLVNDSTLKKQDFYQYMDGLEYDVKKK